MARKTTSKPQADAPALDLHALLVAALKGAGVKATARWAPSKKYASYLVADKNIAYVYAQSRNGIMIRPALTKTELPKGTKGFSTFGKDPSANFSPVITVDDEAGIKAVLPVLLAADAKRKDGAKAAPAKGKAATKRNGKAAAKAASPAPEPEPELTEAEQAAVDALEGVEVKGL